MPLAIKKANLEPAAQHHLGAVQCRHVHFESLISRKLAAVAVRAVVLFCANHTTQPSTVTRRRYQQQQLCCTGKACIAYDVWLFDLQAYSIST